MLAEKIPEDPLPGKKPESFPENCRIAKFAELPAVCQPFLGELMHAEKMSELRILPVKKRTGFSNHVLPA